MNVTILPYIDKTITNTKTTPAESTATGSSSESFDTALLTAKKALAALAVDAAVAQARLNGESGLSLYSETARALNLSVPSDSTSAASDSTDTSTVSAASVSGADSTTDSANDASLLAATARTSSDARHSDSVSAADYSGDLSCSDTLNAYFDEASKTYDIDVKLLKSIAKTESNFSASACSGSGAMGIMQLMPYTAEELGVADAYDAYSNIMGGAKLLAQLLDKYQGDVSLAVAAYNAGSGNVDKYGGIPPFSETQNYVQKVTGYYYS